MRIFGACASRRKNFRQRPARDGSLNKQVEFVVQLVLRSDRASGRARAETHTSAETVAVRAPGQSRLASREQWTEHRRRTTTLTRCHSSSASPTRRVVAGPGPSRGTATDRAIPRPARRSGKRACPPTPRSPRSRPRRSMTRTRSSASTTRRARACAIGSEMPTPSRRKGESRPPVLSSSTEGKPPRGEVGPPSARQRETNPLTRVNACVQVKTGRGAEHSRKMSRIGEGARNPPSSVFF